MSTRDSAESRRRNNLEAFGFSPSTFVSRASSAPSTRSMRASISRSRSSICERPTRPAPRTTTWRRPASRTRARATWSFSSRPTCTCEALAADARAQSTRAQLDTSQALYYAGAGSEAERASSPAIDVVRAEVRLNTDRQRVTASQNDLEKAKLQLARVIGLPVGQPFVVSAQLPNVPVPDMSWSRRSIRRIKARPDYLARSNESRPRRHLVPAAFSEHCRRARSTPTTARSASRRRIRCGTFTLAGAAQHSDLPGRAHAGANRARPTPICASAARRPRTCARRSTTTCAPRFSICRRPASSCRSRRARASWPSQELTQSRDRFAAGIASNIEVVQAQEAVARARRAVHRRDARLRRRQGGARAIARRR